MLLLSIELIEIISIMYSKNSDQMRIHIHTDSTLTIAYSLRTFHIECAKQLTLIRIDKQSHITREL